MYYPPFRAEDETELLRLAIVGMRPYVEDLAEFKPDIIETAWRNVRRGHKVERWPTLQSIREECLRLTDRGSSERGHRSSAPASPSKPWEEKTRRINLLQREYVDDFCRGELADRAKSEGWYTSLWLHCQDAAHYQAQEVLAGIRDQIHVEITSQQIERWMNGVRNPVAKVSGFTPAGQAVRVA